MKHYLFAPVTTLITLFVIAFFTGCASTEESSTTLPVVIGGVFGLTGGDVDLDVPTLHGAELAVKEINDAGGLFGHTLKLQVADCKSDGADAAAAVSSIAKTHDGTLIGYVGLSDSDP